MNSVEKQYTVTELAVRINQSLEQVFSRTVVEGEISQLTRASSGHIYFTLKDESSQLQAALWKGVAARLNFRPKSGDHVRCVITPNMYPRSGRFQLIVHQMIPVGEGDLQKKFLALKAALEKEGIFDQSRKRKLPFFPRHIGVVTSETGAVIHDIMVKIHERMPAVQVTLINVRVQGEGSAAEIAAAIHQFNRVRQVEVLIVGRGGGSLEDLWAFNEEVVVRAIFASQIPVISSVGHETDVTLADLAADVRAPTPTAAAEMVVPHRQELKRRLEEYSRRFKDVDRWFAPFGQTVDQLELRLQERTGLLFEQYHLRIAAVARRLDSVRPASLLAQSRRELDFLDKRLRGSITSRIENYSRQLHLLSGRISDRALKNMLGNNIQTIERLNQSLNRSYRRLIEAERIKVNNLDRALESLNPLSVLKRGYALVEKDGHVVTDADEVQKEDNLSIRLAKGELRTIVSEVVKEERIK